MRAILNRNLLGTDDAGDGSGIHYPNYQYSTLAASPFQPPTINVSQSTRERETDPGRAAGRRRRESRELPAFPAFRVPDRAIMF
jgi:hypothetical protein